MPVRAVARSAGGERARSLDKRAVTSRMPEGHLVSREVLSWSARRSPPSTSTTHNLVGYVMPHIRLELHLPLALSAHHPLQVGVGSSLFAADPAVFQLREMALEEADLVLVRCTGHIRRTSLDAEMIKHGALVDRCCGLWDQLRAPHVTVPFCSAVDGDLGTLLGVCVARVLVRRGQVDVGSHGSRAVDVVLVRTDLIRPRPLIQIGGRGEIIEATVPEDSAFGSVSIVVPTSEETRRMYLRRQR